MEFLPNCECTNTAVWVLSKRTEKKLEGKYTRMLWVILKKSRKQHQMKQQLYNHLPPISKTIQVRWTRYVEHNWRSKNELISDVLQWTLTHGNATILTGQQEVMCVDTGCNLEGMSGAMDDRDGWRTERIRKKSMLSVQLDDDNDDEITTTSICIVCL